MLEFLVFTLPIKSTEVHLLDKFCEAGNIQAQER